jgi:hypothetical protein
MRKIHLLAFVLLLTLAGCKQKQGDSSRSAAFAPPLPEVLQICNVTHDGEKGYAVTWDSQGYEGTSVFVYRKFKNGKFEQIGSVPLNQNYFIDTIDTHKSTTPYQYEISIDQGAHSSIHISIFREIVTEGNNHFIKWNAYSGRSDISRYEVVEIKSNNIHKLVETVYYNGDTSYKIELTNFNTSSEYYIHIPDFRCPSPKPTPADGTPGRESTRSNYNKTPRGGTLSDD